EVVDVDLAPTPHRHNHAISYRLTSGKVDIRRQRTVAPGGIDRQPAGVAGVGRSDVQHHRAYTAAGHAARACDLHLKYCAWPELCPRVGLPRSSPRVRDACRWLRVEVNLRANEQLGDDALDIRAAIGVG